MNIVLTSVHIAKTPDAIPLAPALLKTYLDNYNKNLNLNTTILETTLESDKLKFVDEILKNKPNVVGLSIYLWNREFYLDIIKLLRSKSNEIIIIAGGAEVRSDYNALLDEGVNYTIQGEGEECLFELINKIYYKKNCLDIPGVNDNIIRSVKDLNTIPSPIISKTINLKNYDGILWELSRGCPFSCDFCFESRGTKGVRYYNFDRIISELKIIIENSVPQVFVLDPTFNKDIVRAKQILKEIIKFNRGTHFHFEVRAEFLDNEICELFQEVGASLQIGIQSSNDNVLKLINRRINKTLFSKKIDLLNYNGVIFGLDLIYGLPNDNYIGFKESMEYVLTLQPNHLDIFPLAVLPGTALWDNSDKLLLNYLKKPPYTVISSPTFSESDMKKSEILKSSCDYIYNKGRSTGWLKQLCNELQINMTDFIENFYSWNINKNLNDKLSVVDTIKSYIKDNFSTKYLELIFDIINYHTAYSDAILLEKPITTIDNNILVNKTPSFTPNSTLLNFSYPILEAFENGYYTIDVIKENFKPKKNIAISWCNSEGEVIIDCYRDDIMLFLNKIDGKKTCYEINNNIDKNFLIFAQNSGLLLFN